MRVTTIRFNLKFFNANGREEIVQTLDDLRSKYNPSELYEYFKTGELSRWLRSINESKIADKIDLLSTIPGRRQSVHKLCSTLELAIRNEELVKSCNNLNCPARTNENHNTVTLKKRKKKSRKAVQEISEGPKRDIYCGNLAYSITDDGLMAAFAEYGDVAYVHVVKDRMTKRSKGYGFVKMSDRTQAQVAINALNGKILDGRPIRVNWSANSYELADQCKEKQGEAMRVIPRDSNGDIFCGNLAYSITDDSLMAEFAEYGDVAFAHVVKDSITKRSKGYGFVEMLDRTQAQVAIIALDGKMLEGRPIRVNWRHSLEVK